MTSPMQPAFPELHIHHFQNEDVDGKHDNVVPRWMGGLTKREYFAAMAMQGLIGSEQTVVIAQMAKERDMDSGKIIAALAVGHADALIAELSK